MKKRRRILLRKLTKKQELLIIKAKAYKKTWLTKPFRRIYQEVCSDGYIPAYEFRAMVLEQNPSNILQFNKPQPTMEIREYLTICESRLQGKAPEETSGIQEKKHG